MTERVDDEVRLLGVAARLLAALVRPGAGLLPTGEDRYEVRIGDERAPRASAPAAVVEEMRRRDWLARADGGGYVASEAGRAMLKRQRRPDAPWRGQHLALSRPPAVAPDASAAVDNESPLAWLARRRDCHGRPLISPAQAAAGERLRADFTRARMSPRVTADWSGTAARRGRRGPPNDAAAFADAVLAARQRVERALEACGRELASLLVDVCCLLSGLEDAERARGWPRRSGKVVLGIALDRLARHYGLDDAAHGPDRARRLVHWGDADYRPRADFGA